MSLFDRPIAADRAISDGETEPCLILGTIPGMHPEDFPFLLIVKPSGELGATELPYVTTKWRWNAETERWDDLLPLYELSELIVGGEIGETVEEETTEGV